MARNYHGDLVSFCITEWSTTYLEADPSSLNAMDDGDYGWRRWYEAESRRRTGYCIWVSFQLYLDVLAHNSTAVRLYVGIHFQTRPLLSLEDARVPIPCQEVLWEAQTALDWQQLHACADRTLFTLFGEDIY
jgi:hypothetical protein